MCFRMFWGSIGMERAGKLSEIEGRPLLRAHFERIDQNRARHTCLRRGSEQNGIRGACHALELTCLAG